ncbi:hypothetical protein Golob_024124, partial [Gossypium lobatum]|nr:hypothetical protein [Gossypium lobatum]
LQLLQIFSDIVKFNLRKICLSNKKLILNYPSENESLMQSPTHEEIIQGVMDVLADDEQDPDDSRVLPHVSPKE